MARLPARLTSKKKKAPPVPAPALSKLKAVPGPELDEESDEDGDILPEGASDEEEGDDDLLQDDELDDVDGEGSGEDSEDEDEDEGVDEAGMKRLMAALGDDGLKDFELAQLGALDGEGQDEGSDEENGDAESGSGEDEEEDEGVDALSDEFSEDEAGETETPTVVTQPNGNADDLDEDEDAVALDDVESVDEDAVPRQKIEVDNTVRSQKLLYVAHTDVNVQVAMQRIRDTIQLDPRLPWTETLVVTYPEKIEVDVEDDLAREVAL
jgi:rRNA-processing protein EBP2